MPLKELHLLVGNCELPLTAIMTFLVRKEIGDEAKESFSDTGDLAQFIVHDDARNYDLVILVLNNILCENMDENRGSRIDRAIRAIERIKPGRTRA